MNHVHLIKHKDDCDTNGAVFAAFSTKQKALDAQTRFPAGDYEVVSIPFDHVPVFPQGKNPYGVFLTKKNQYGRKDCELNSTYETSKIDLTIDLSPIDYHFSYYDDLHYFMIWAFDAQSAEMRAKEWFWELTPAERKKPRS
jgi:hypothetical protein